MLEAFQPCEQTRVADAAIEIPIQSFPEDVSDERTFSRTADAGDADE